MIGWLQHIAERLTDLEETLGRIEARLTPEPAAETFPPDSPLGYPKDEPVDPNAPPPAAPEPTPEPAPPAETAEEQGKPAGKAGKADPQP